MADDQNDRKPEPDVWKKNVGNDQSDPCGDRQSHNPQNQQAKRLTAVTERKTNDNQCSQGEPQ